mmetsp:Transcript_6455/g.26209  ORF Transcript_6455/g.26209 Transcript_6455/m.26209 type:complete len:431 (+) Transcript_6455:9552-10844(+)
MPSRADTWVSSRARCSAASMTTAATLRRSGASGFSRAVALGKPRLRLALPRFVALSRTERASPHSASAPSLATPHSASARSSASPMRAASRAILMAAPASSAAAYSESACSYTPKRASTGTASAAPDTALADAPAPPCSVSTWIAERTSSRTSSADIQKPITFNASVTLSTTFAAASGTPPRRSSTKALSRRARTAAAVAECGHNSDSAHAVAASASALVTGKLFRASPVVPVSKMLARTPSHARRSGKSARHARSMKCFAATDTACAHARGSHVRTELDASSPRAHIGSDSCVNAPLSQEPRSWPSALHARATNRSSDELSRTTAAMRASSEATSIDQAKGQRPGSISGSIRSQCAILAPGPLPSSSANREAQPPVTGQPSTLDAAGDESIPLAPLCSSPERASSARARRDSLSTSRSAARVTLGAGRT